MIAAIDAIMAPVAEATKGMDLFSLNILPNNKELKDLPLSQFIELCEHYQTEPSVGRYPNAWLKSGFISIHITCEKVEVDKPVEGIALLRKIAKADPEGDFVRGELKNAFKP